MIRIVDKAQLAAPALWNCAQDIIIFDMLSLVHVTFFGFNWSMANDGFHDETSTVTGGGDAVTAWKEEWGNLPSSVSGAVAIVKKAALKDICRHAWRMK